ncbi:hypothetical protein K502DRAFT_366135 [Neoconidiobolus thromboides FSU 785]|nr:hypothetical protein K502DRAFT_366135 [Neoconidiobolus thromboides FSU 785]
MVAQFKIDLEKWIAIDKESLLAILNTILFHRVFGIIQPIESENELHYLKVKDEALKSKIESITYEAINRIKIDKEHLWLIELTLMERKYRKAWFSVTEEEVDWEHWSLILNDHTNANYNNTNKERQIKKILMSIIHTMDQFKEHIPPITSKDKFVFPYKLNLKSQPINTKDKIQGLEIEPMNLLN